MIARPTRYGVATPDGWFIAEARWRCFWGPSPVIDVALGAPTASRPPFRLTHARVPASDLANEGLTLKPLSQRHHPHI